MNIIKLFLEEYGDKIYSGLASNQGLANNEVKKTTKGTLNILLGGLLQTSNNKTGLKKIHSLLSGKKYNGELLNNVGGQFTGPASLKLTKEGLEILPEIFGSDNKVAEILDVAGNVFGGGISRAQSFFSMLAPLMLSFIAKHVQNEKLNTNGLQQLIQNQYSFVENNLDDELLDALDISAYADEQEEELAEVSNENVTATNEVVKKPVKKKNGLPVWAWAAICILPVVALFSLTTMCGQAPEQTRYADKNKKVNPKNNQQKKVKPKTNVASINKNTNNKNNTVTNKPANINKPANSTSPQKNQSTANNRPNVSKNNQSTAATQSNNNNLNAVSSQNQANNKNNAAAQNPNEQIKPKVQQLNNTTAQQPNRNVKTSTNTNQVIADNKPVNKPVANTQKPVDKSNIESKYRGSASKVDIAAQTNSTEIINFGTVTNDNKTLTPSSYSNFIKIANILKDNPKTTITLRAHNRDYTIAAENQSAKNQGKIRADMLKKVLVDSGVATSRIKVELIGHAEPLITQDPTHIRNKRISVKIN